MPKNKFILHLFSKIFCILLTLGILSPKAFARLSPSGEDWITQETAHFYVMYPKRLLDLGRHYADIAEDSYKNLTTVFTVAPDKINLIISDYTDDSNGYATIFPYPIVVLYPVQVSNEITLSESGEWARELITHELTHILQMYPYHKGYKYLRPIFGTVISPNLLTPTWWKEGMAVEMETRFSPKGRLRSTLQDAQIRSYVLSDRLKEFSVGEINENLITWPYGNRPYFFGSLLMNQLSTLPDKNIFDTLVQTQASRWPFALNGTLENTLQTDFNEQYLKTIEAHQKFALEQIQTLKTLTPTTGQSFDSDLYQSRAPQVFKDGVAVLATNYRGLKIQFYQKDLTKLKQKAPGGDLGTFVFSPDYKTLYFNRLKEVSPYEQYSDLYSYDIENNKTERLTTKERARDPIISPDGTKLAYVKLDGGKTELKFYDLPSKKPNSLVAVSFEDRINSYTFISNNELLYSTRNTHGEQILNKINLETLKSTLVSTSLSQVKALRFKNNFLYFISDQNGVQNIYKAEVAETALKNETPITHLLTGTTSFDLSDDSQTLYYTLVTENGPQVTSANLTSQPNIDALPVVKNMMTDKYQFQSQSVEKNPNPKEDNYSSFSQLWPHYWIPFLSSNLNNDGVFLQAMTGGQDPLNYQVYSLQANYDTGLDRFGYLVTYTNSIPPWPVNLLSYKTSQLYGASSIIDRQLTSLTVFPEIFAISEDFKLAVGGQITEADNGNLKTQHLGSFLQLQYANVTQKPFHYYPIQGIRFLAKYSQNQAQHENLSSVHGNYTQAVGNLTLYNSYLLPQHHVLYLKIDGLYTFENVHSRYGSSNSVASTLLDDGLPYFSNRGYIAGQFFGSQIFTANLEYRFPIYDIERGPNSKPLFFKYLTGAVVVDGLAVKGWAGSTDKTAPLKPMQLTEHIWSVGLEARMSTTIGYLLPISLVLGVYQPLAKDYAENLTGGISIQAGGR